MFACNSITGKDSKAIEKLLLPITLTMSVPKLRLKLKQTSDPMVKHALDNIIKKRLGTFCKKNDWQKELLDWMCN